MSSGELDKELAFKAKLHTNTNVGIDQQTVPSDAPNNATLQRDVTSWQHGIYRCGRGMQLSHDSHIRIASARECRCHEGVAMLRRNMHLRTDSALAYHPPHPVLYQCDDSVLDLFIGVGVRGYSTQSLWAQEDGWNHSIESPDWRIVPSEKISTSAGSVKSLGRVFFID